MALFGIMFTMVFAIGLYPNANLTASIGLALIPAIIVALTYYIMSVAMPRTGGDYVWVGRIIHPALGFMVNFGLTFYLFTFIAIDVGIFTQWGIGAYFYNIGVSSNNAGALSLSSLLNQTGSLLVFGVSVVLIVIATLLVALGAKTAMRIQRIGWAIVLIAGVAYIALALSTGPSKFVSNFNSLSGTNVTSVISSAQGQGWIPTVTLFGTVVGFVYMFLNFTGFNFSTYLSGEVKNARRSQLIGILGALLVFAVIAILFVQVTEYVFGYNFFHALTYLWDEIFYGTNLQAPYPTTLGPGFPVFLIGFLTANPILIFIITIGVSMTMFFNVVPYIFVSTRNMFAWSFDRSAPEILSRVDNRFHTPYIALIVTAILSVVMTFISVFTSIALLFTYLTILVAILFLIVGFAAILFPYRRKDIFGSSPDVVQRKVGGVPVIVVLGVLTVLSSLFIGYSVFLPQFSGPFILDNFLLLVTVLVAPLLIYAACYYYYKSKGIPISLAQKEIPPE
jgi:amino acid transporter